MSAHPDHDPNHELWVEVEGLGRCLLCGNAQTFPGRISAWSLDRQTGVTISKYEVLESSEAAAHWIDGFLTGNEPSFAEFMGVDPGDEPNDPAADARYEQFLADFHEHGSAPILKPRPSQPVSSDAHPDHRPWTLVGGEVWVWERDQWSVASPQPNVVDGFLAGTLCAERGHCDLTVVGTHHVICDDCGDTTEVVVEPEA